MNNPLLMTQGEFARRRGVLPSAVSNWKKKDLLVFAEGPGGKLLVDVVKTEARLNAKVDTTRGRPSKGSGVSAPASGEAPAGPTDSGAPEPTDNPRMALLQQNVIALTMKNMTAAGELVSREEYERRAAEMGRQIRDRVMGVVRDLADRMAVETEPRTIVALQQDAYDRMFGELATDIEQGVLASEDLAEAELDDVEAPEEDAV